MKDQLMKAHANAFDAHEAHRQAISQSREKLKAAKEADERVRQLRSLARERAQARAVKTSRRNKR